MPGISRMMAVLLLVSVAAALPGTQAFAMAAGQFVQPARAGGCHAHSPALPPPSPAPAPVSYQCCVNGHHWAIPSASFSARPLAALQVELDRGSGIPRNSIARAHCANLIVPSVSPPGVAPLRI